jgi:hypothetical protein
MLQHSKPQSKKTPVKAKTASPQGDKTRTRKQASRQEQAAPATSLQQRQQMINEAAYYIAQQRGFIGGNPVDDWLTAETEVDKQLSMTRR